MGWRYGLFGAAKWPVLHCRTACFAPSNGLFRNAKRQLPPRLPHFVNIYVAFRPGRDVGTVISRLPHVASTFHPRCGGVATRRSTFAGLQPAFPPLLKCELRVTDPPFPRGRIANPPERVCDSIAVVPRLPVFLCKNGRIKKH